MQRWRRTRVTVEASAKKRSQIAAFISFFFKFTSYSVLHAVVCVLLLLCAGFSSADLSFGHRFTSPAVEKGSSFLRLVQVKNVSKSGFLPPRWRLQTPKWLFGLHHFVGLGWQNSNLSSQHSFTNHEWSSPVMEDCKIPAFLYVEWISLNFRQLFHQLSHLQRLHFFFHRFFFSFLQS